MPLTTDSRNTKLCRKLIVLMMLISFNGYLNKFECTMDQELADKDTAACAQDGHFVCPYQVAALLRLKWRHGRRLWRHIKNPTPSINVNLPEKQSCQICYIRVLHSCTFCTVPPSRSRSRSDLKRRSLRLFWKGRPNKKNNKNKMSSDRRSVPNAKKYENTQVLILLLKPLKQTQCQCLWYRTGNRTKWLMRHVFTPSVNTAFFCHFFSVVWNRTEYLFLFFVW